MAPFYGWSSTASRLDPLQEDSLLFTTKFLDVSVTHFINLERMKGWIELVATQWLWTQDPWVGNPVPCFCEIWALYVSWITYEYYHSFLQGLEPPSLLSESNPNWYMSIVENSLKWRCRLCINKENVFYNVSGVRQSSLQGQKFLGFCNGKLHFCNMFFVTH